MPDGKAGIDAFAVIRDAMKDQDRVALARIVLTNREHVIAIEPLGKGLLGTTLRYPYELRDEDGYFDDIKNPKISKDMIELASHILDTKAAHFDPSKFKDEYENALKALVRRKASGKPVKVVEREEKADNVINLMDALKQSLKGKAATKAAGQRPGIAPGAATARGEEGAPVGGAGPQGGVIWERSPQSSCPGLTRASTTSFTGSKDVDGRVKPGHDENWWMPPPTSSPSASSPSSASWLLSCRLLRHLLALGARLGKPDRDRLLLALHRPAGTAALQGAGLAFLHRALDVGGSFLRIFSCHGLPPGCRENNRRIA